MNFAFLRRWKRCRALYFTLQKGTKSHSQKKRVPRRPNVRDSTIFSSKRTKQAR